MSPARARLDDEPLAREALDLAALGAGRVAPNPLVGALVVTDAGEVVGRGSHVFADRDHAEVVALREAGERARGATLHVTLEPCSSHGRTPPCVDAVVAAGVRRVVACTADPDERHAGRGFAALAAAGIEVRAGVLRREAARLNERWLCRMRTGRPHVTLKLATSLDGRVAARDGSSRWVTGEAARRRAHGLRAWSDAVLVGAGTLRADDPRLTVRDPSHPRAASPLRAALDPGLSCRPSASLLRPVGDDERGGPALLFAAEDADAEAERMLRAAGADVERVPRAAAGLDLRAVLAALVRRGVDGLLVEGGPRVAGAFLEAGLVDRMEWHVAPALLGEHARASLVGWSARDVEDARRLASVTVERAGDDVVVRGVVRGGFDPDEEAARLERLEGGA